MSYVRMTSKDIFSSKSSYDSSPSLDRGYGRAVVFKTFANGPNEGIQYIDRISVTIEYNHPSKVLLF